MIAQEESINVFVNLPPEGQQDKVVEVFNWQGAYGEPWKLEGGGEDHLGDFVSMGDAHLGDLVAEWWGPKFGVKFWAEMDKCVVLYNWDKNTGEYDLIGILCTLCDPRKCDQPDSMDVWHHSLVPNGDGSYSVGCFTWLGAKEAEMVVYTLQRWRYGVDSEWPDAANPPNEDKVKAVISNHPYWTDPVEPEPDGKPPRSEKPHIFDGSEVVKGVAPRAKSDIGLELDLQHADRLIALDPEDADAYKNRAWVYGELGEYELALADLDRAIELNPQDGINYSLRGTIYAKSGQDAQAIEDLEKALALGSSADRWRPDTEALLEEVRLRLCLRSSECEALPQEMKKGNRS